MDRHRHRVSHEQSVSLEDRIDTACQADRPRRTLATGSAVFFLVVLPDPPQTDRPRWALRACPAIPLLLVLPDPPEVVNDDGLSERVGLHQHFHLEQRPTLRRVLTGERPVQKDAIGAAAVGRGPANGPRLALLGIGATGEEYARYSRQQEE